MHTISEICQTHQKKIGGAIANRCEAKRPADRRDGGERDERVRARQLTWARDESHVVILSEKTANCGPIRAPSSPIGGLVPLGPPPPNANPSRGGGERHRPGVKA